jgi:hypothetical protein
MALGSQIVNLVRLHLLHNVQEARRISHIAIVQHKLTAREMRIFIEVIHPCSVEQRGTPLHPVNLVTLT